MIEERHQIPRNSEGKKKAYLGLIMKGFEKL
jgi:hypothetical protein